MSSFASLRHSNCRQTMTKEEYLDSKRRERTLADWSIGVKVDWSVDAPWVNHRIGDWGNGIRRDFY